MEPPPSGRSAVPLQPYIKTRGIFLADEGHQYLWTITLAYSAQILSRVVYLLLISQIPIRRHALSHTPSGGCEVSNTVVVLHIAPIHLSVCTIAPTKERYANWACWMVVCSQLRKQIPQVMDPEEVGNAFGNKTYGEEMPERANSSPPRQSLIAPARFGHGA